MGCSFSGGKRDLSESKKGSPAAVQMALKPTGDRPGQPEGRKGAGKLQTRGKKRTESTWGEVARRIRSIYLRKGPLPFPFSVRPYKFPPCQNSREDAPSVRSFRTPSTRLHTSRSYARIDAFICGMAAASPQCIHGITSLAAGTAQFPEAAAAAFARL